MFRSFCGQERDIQCLYGVERFMIQESRFELHEQSFPAVPITLSESAGKEMLTCSPQHVFMKNEFY